MPLSDNYRYNVGDRVKSDVTQEEGRVIDIKSLGEGALLITVAVFIAGVAAGSKSFVQKIDQIAGLEWSIIGSAVKDGASKQPLITNPMEGGQISARAGEIAFANEPSDRSLSKLIADRLKAWNPRLADPNDPLAYMTAVNDQIENLKRIRTGVFKRKGRIDTLLNYLTATGHKNAEGQWVGSYLVELVHNRSSASAAAIEKGDAIRKILQRTGIPVELSLRYRELIPEGVTTAWELLVHAKQRVAGLNYIEGNPLWNDYAAILRRAVELSPHRKRQQARIDGINEAIDYFRDDLEGMQNASWTSGVSLPVAANDSASFKDRTAFKQGLREAYRRPFDPTSYQIEGGVTAPEESARNMHQLEQRLFGAGAGRFEECRIGVRVSQFKSPGQGGIGVVKRVTIPVAKKAKEPIFITHGRRFNPQGFVRLPAEKHHFPYNIPPPISRTGQWWRGKFIESPQPHGATISSILPGVIQERVAAERAAELEKNALFMGPPVRIRESGRGIDPFSLNRQEQGPTLESVLEGPETIVSRDIGQRTGRVRNLLSERAEVRAQRLKAFFPFEQNIGGQIVQYKGLPYRVTAVDTVTKRATLTPLHTDVELLASDILTRPNEALKAVKEAGRGRANLPLVGQIEQQAVQDATRIAAKVATHQTVTIRGGLLGKTAETVHVPLDLLREYLTGGSTIRTGEVLRDTGMPVFQDAQTLRAAGFAGQADFRKSARSFTTRFEAQLRSRLETHPRLAGATGKFQQQKLEELLHGAQIGVIEHLANLRGGRTIQQIEAELLEVGVQRAAHFAFGSEVSVVAQTFTELDRVDEAGELLESGLDRVSRIEARSQRPWKASRLDNINFVTNVELEHDIQRFSQAIQDLRWKRDSSKIAEIYRNTFGEYDPTLPHAVANEEAHILGQARLAVDIADLMETHGLGAPETRQLLTRFSRRQGIKLFSGSALTERLYEQYRDATEIPSSLGSRQDVVNAAAEEFQRSKAIDIEAVQHRFYAQRTITPGQLSLRIRNLVNEVAEAEQDAEDEGKAVNYARIWKQQFPQSHPDIDARSLVERARALDKDLGGQSWHASSLHDQLAAFTSEFGYVVDKGKGSGLVPITAENEKAVVQMYQAALDFPVEQQPAVFRALGIHPIAVGNQPGAVVTSRSGERFLLQQTEGGLAAVSQSNPNLVRFLGGANQPFEVDLQGLEHAARSGALNVVANPEKVTKTLKTTAERVEQEAILHQFVGQPPSTLPLFRSGSTVAGFLGTDLVNPASVIANAKAALEGQRPLLFIDIETNRETNRITNFGLRRLEKVGGDWQEVGDSVHIATPELWQTHDGDVIGGSAASRVATRNGYTSLINEVVHSEQEIAQRAASLLAEHPEALVVGHNIGFDIGKLAKVEGLEESAAATLTQAARSRVTDTMLLAQLTHPDQSALSLKALGATIAGQPLEEAHLALPDVQRTIEVFRSIASRSEAGQTALSALEQTQLNDNSVVFFHQGPAHLRGRAFRVAGVLDAQAAGDAFYQQTQRNLNVGFGVALQPINFLTGEAEGPTVLNFGITPHHWARSFAGQAEVLDKETARVAMEEKVGDLARRRARRLIGDEQGFVKLLHERERLRLADVFAEGPEQFAAAQDALLSRLGTAESPFERSVLRGTHQYSQTWLQDTRIARQLQREKGFFQEVEQAHAPVVNWLESALRDASESELPAMRQTVNRIWSDYMAQVKAAPGGAFATVPVAPESAVSLNIPALGRTVKWSARDATTLRSSIQRTVMEVASQVQGTPEFKKALLGLSEEDRARVNTLIANRRNILDVDLGGVVEQHIFEHHLAPALQQSIQTEARTVDEAVPQVLHRVVEIAREMPPAENPLIPRSIAADALASIRDRIGVGGDVLTEAERLLTPENFRVALHHHAPHTWTGKGFLDLLHTAVNADALEQMQFTDRLRGIYKKMATSDQELLGQAVQKAAPQWFDEITGKRAVEAVAAAAPVRDFNPGIVTQAAIEVGEAASENATALKGLGLFGLGVVAAGVALLARRPQASPQKSREEDDQEKILHSTEKEVARRKEKVANQVPMVSNIRVSITGNDPVGVSHDELIQSVHSTMGSFLGTEISRAANIHDRRSRVDHNYLDRVAAQLLQKPTPVR